MKTKTQTILQVMNVLTWIVFIGILIEGGATLFSFIISFFNSDAAFDLYKGLDLFPLRETDFRHYTAVVSFMVVLYGLKAYTAYLVIMIMSKINLKSPFSKTIADLIEKISFVLFEIFIISVIFNGYIKWLSESYIIEYENVNSSEFLFLAGIIYIIAQVFKKGLEIQSENELTI